MDLARGGDAVGGGRAIGVFWQSHPGGLPPPRTPHPGARPPDPHGRFAPAGPSGSIHESFSLDYDVLWPQDMSRKY